MDIFNIIILTMILFEVPASCHSSHASTSVPFFFAPTTNASFVGGLLPEACYASILARAPTKLIRGMQYEKRSSSALARAAMSGPSLHNLGPFCAQSVPLLVPPPLPPLVPLLRPR